MGEQLIVGVLKSMEALREYDNKASFPMDFKLQVVALQFKAGLVGSSVCLCWLVLYRIKSNGNKIMLR